MCFNVTVDEGGEVWTSETRSLVTSNEVSLGKLRPITHKMGGLAPVVLPPWCRSTRESYYDRTFPEGSVFV